MSFSLSGKVAIVTGANQGLGLEIARRFVQSGASLVLCARDRQRLDEARKELRSTSKDGQRVETVEADVSNPGDVSRVVGTTLSQFGHVDVLVNNAGVYGPMGPVETVDWEQWVKAIEINLFGSVLMCRAVLPAMKARRKGKI